MNLKQYLSNGWNWFYLACGALCTQYVGLLSKRGLIGGMAVSLIIAFLKETCDGISSKTKYKGRFGLDPAGFDKKDIVMTLIGAMITIGFNYFGSYFQLLKLGYDPIYQLFWW